MAGITSFGAYVPYLRLPLATIGGGKPVDGGPEKAVANWDEDSVTMAVAAAGDSLRAGTNALRMGLDAIKAGSAKRVLVVAGEMRMAAPRSAMEMNIGDGG